jgi:hypothetical protein
MSYFSKPGYHETMVLVNHEPNKGIDGQGSDSLNQQTKRAKERNPQSKQSIYIA